MYHRLSQSYPRSRTRAEYPKRKKKILFSSGVATSANNVLTFNQNATCVHVLPTKTANNTLVFTQTAVGVNTTIKQVINFVENVSVTTVLNRSISHTLIFSQVAEATVIHVASNIITFAQTATVTVSIGVNQILSLIQNVSVAMTPHNENVQQILTFTQTAVDNQVLNRNANNTLVFTQTATAIRVRNLSANNLFVVSQNLSGVGLAGASNTFVINQSATVIRIHNLSASNILILNQSVSRQMIYTQNINHTLTFFEGWLKPTGFGFYPVPGAVLTKTNKITVLQVPGRSITLPQPVFNDSENGLGKILLKRTILGDTFTYVRRSLRRKLKYTFIIQRDKAYELKDYVSNYLATPITLHNFKGEIWYGFITNNPVIFPAKRRGEEYEVELDFEGIQVN